jgi:NAD+ diphosphatase
MTFIPQTVPPASFAVARWFIFRNGRLLVHEQSADVPRLTDAGSLGLPALRNIFVGSLFGEPSFALEVEEGSPAPEGMMWEGLRALFMHYDQARIAAAGRAVQLLDWDRDHRFCGRCAARTVQLEHERGRRCPSCGLTAWPRIAPAMMALVKRGRQLLLARSPHAPQGRFSALAGFVEAGESVEDTVVREVREEVGIEIANPRYFGSQSWPFPNSLMIAFVCDYAGGEITPQEGEIDEWFDVDALPDISSTVSIAGRLIRSLAEELRQQVSR